ncbi:hypothetical protein AGOR_G00141570 [Albula goreensis]|uniref:Spindle and centriole-associated protein 1 n=1 Tax=Albula goreensis TaxID=1534307 RepID=A0A8T3D0R1_9TELE|nr:hypothetical protein AGOR_G00141570 [Albula goreensis]
MNRSSRGLGKRPAQTRKATGPKQEWVSTIHDLNVHRATPEELKRRHELHKSQNRAAAQWDMRERTLRRRLRKTPPLSPSQLDPAHLNIIREVLSDQLQMQQVVARSDRALAVVKDLFGDAPHRQMGFPNVTVAPDSGPDPELPVLLKPEPPTQLSLLSQSVMDTKALNELEDGSDEEYSEEESDPLSSMSRFGQLLQREAQVPFPSTPAAPGPQAALNATVAVRRVRSRQSQCGGEPVPTQVGQFLKVGPAAEGAARKAGSNNTSRQRCCEALAHDSSNLSGNQSSLSVLQCMLGEVEAELDAMECQEPISSSAPQKGQPGLTGFSVSLLQTMSRLARCLKQSREEVCREVQKRQKLEKEVMEQRRLIDALTAETLSLREDNLALQAQLQQCVWDTEQQQLETQTHRQTSQAHPAPSDRTALYSGCEEVEAQRSHSGRKLQDQAPPPLSQRARPAPCPAVLLSPPRQRDSLPPHTHIAEQGLPMQHQTACSQRSEGEQERALPPAPSRTTPHTVSQAPPPAPPRTTPHALPPATVLQQIAELTRQNAVIRAQLQQFCTQPAGAAEHQDLRPDMATASRGPTAQEKAPPAGACVEQRLLELNRQSAAARRRLLELIEEQTCASVSAVSPSVSPIPPPCPALAPLMVNADGEIGSLESVPLPDHNSSSRSVGSISPLNGAVGENRASAHRTQVDRLKDEGWFALSNHVQ